MQYERKNTPRTNTLMHDTFVNYIVLTWLFTNNISDIFTEI